MKLKWGLIQEIIFYSVLIGGLVAIIVNNISPVFICSGLGIVLAASILFPIIANAKRNRSTIGTISAEQANRIMEQQAINEKYIRR